MIQAAAKPISVQAGRAVPFWLPASHFVCGLGFLCAATLLLSTVVGDLVDGRFLITRVAGVVHLITLGWLTLSILGALCQLFPVALGTSLYSVKLALVTLVLFVPGVALFVAGLLTSGNALVLTGAATFVLGLLIFVYNAYRTLFRSKTRDLTWWTLAGAFGFLIATIAFGASLAINLKTMHLGSERLIALAVHIHVAVAGWVGLVIMAVGRRLLPMFLLSHAKHERALQLAIVATASGAATLSLLHGWMNARIFTVGALLILAGAISFAVQIGTYLRARHRPQLDAGLRLVVGGAAFVIVAALLGTFLLLTPGNHSVITTAYGVALLGGLMLFVAGHYYKILPFLLWNSRFAPLAGKRPLPKIAELYNARVANTSVALSLIGLAVLFAGVLVAEHWLALTGAVALAGGAAIEATQLIQLLRTKVV